MKFDPNYIFYANNVLNNRSLCNNLTFMVGHLNRVGNNGPVGSKNDHWIEFKIIIHLLDTSLAKPFKADCWSWLSF